MFFFRMALYSINNVQLLGAIRRACIKFTLIGITSIKGSPREGINDAVAKCHKAGFAVKMCTKNEVHVSIVLPLFSGSTLEHHLEFPDALMSDTHKPSPQHYKIFILQYFQHWFIWIIAYWQRRGR